MVLFFSDMISRCLQAESKTKDPKKIPQTVDLAMLWPVVRVAGCCAVVPPVYFPLALLHAYGYVRCLGTSTYRYRQDLPKYTGKVKYAVHRREYNRERKKVFESIVYEESEETKRALEVVGKKRNEYVMDPTNSKVSYFVLEQHELNGKNLLQGEKYAWTMIAEFVRYGGACTMCLAFRPAAKRFRQDVLQYLRGTLPIGQVRHPLMNFYMTINEYNKAKFRINARLPADARPWNYKL